MKKNEYVTKFLYSQTIIENNPYRESMLRCLLQGARKLSGRCLATGTYLKNEYNEENFENRTYYSFQFTGLLTYLIVLEQLGCLFRPKNQSSFSEKNEIYQTLRHFSNLDHEKAMAIKALRNSLSHKFSLATENGKHEKYKFILSSTRDKSIINIGTWDGDFANRGEETLTKVYVHDLIDLSETIYQTICEHWEKGELEMLLMNKWDEFETRFTFRD